MVTAEGARGRPRPRYIATRSIELDAEVPPEHIFRELVAAYLSAAPRVLVRQDGGVRVSTRAVVASFQARVENSTAIEEEGGALVIQGLDREVPPPLAALTFRLGERALELLRDAGRESFPPVSEEEWQRRDDAVDALAWEVHRRVMRAWVHERGVPRDERIDPIGWLEASRALERIADHAVLLGIQWARWRATEHGQIESRLVADIHHQAFEYVTSALVILGDPRPGPANAALDLGSALRETVDTLLDRLLPVRGPSLTPSASAVVSLGGILHSLDRVVAYGQDLLEIALDHARVARTSASVSAAAPIRSEGSLPARSGNPSPHMR